MKNKELIESSDKTTAKDILGNPGFPAISYGGYRHKTRDIQPTLDELKEDMRLLFAMGVRVLRTYNVKLPQASNILRAIHELKQENSRFEMYVMLGAWIDCKNAWGENTPNHNEESPENEAEIKRAVFLANQYPDIVKIIAVGNEAMVKWASAYYVQPDVILKWVNYIQDLKKNGKLSNEIWVTSSDNFASWGGGSEEYHVDALKELIGAVDYISMHTYPMHDTHYNPAFWGVLPSEDTLTKKVRIQRAMERARDYAIGQYQAVKTFVESLGLNKPIHIGETGWSSASNEFYGPDGTRATDEYKEGLYYHLIREWSQQQGVSCFYFEAIDEPWKDAQNPGGSENHFGLFTATGMAKYALWSMVDEGIFDGLTRAGNPIVKTYKGMEDSLLNEVLIPPTLDTVAISK